MHDFTISIGFILTIVSLNIFAAPHVGKVIALRGDVTILRPKHLKAEVLSKGDAVQEKSSILAKKRSFARIRLSNGSVITVGPNSKIVVDMIDKKGGGVVNLLMGTVRAKIQKSHEKKNLGKEKFFINTRVASMGVRGTEFQACFSPKSLRTSLLTFEGSVAFKKVSPKDSIEIHKAESSSKVARIRKLFKVVKLEVKRGDFSNLTFKTKTASMPVKLNPTQYVLLKKDKSLGAVRIRHDKKKLAKEILDVKRVFNKEIASQGLIRKKVKDFGLIDPATGIYVAPVNSKKPVGKVNMNGEFIAPKGLKVDDVQGFIAVNEEDSSAVKEAEKLNEGLKGQISDIDDPAYKKYFLH
ncbi:MAG: FecR domain-containing protein [Bacteriovoracaceae bacterium]|nr:FecR domain-containing protein [Bacteriovoracaceae bacterium]